MTETKNRDSVLKLLNFLKEFNTLKLKKILNVNSFDEVLWMSEVPKEKECCSIIYDLNSENINFNKWIEIKKPVRKLCPALPEKLKPWVNNTLNKKSRR